MIKEINARSKNDINKPFWFNFAYEDYLYKTMQNRFIDSDLMELNTYIFFIAAEKEAQ